MARSNARLLRFGFFAALLILCGYILSKGSSATYTIPQTAPVAGSNKNADVPAAKEAALSNHTPKTASAGKVKATFVTLARNRDIWELLESIRQIEDKFNSKFHYDWVFLNDEEFNEEFKRETTRMISGTTHYGKIDQDQWSFPEWIDVDKAAETRRRMKEEKIIYGDSISYRHMCRFESGFFFRHPLMQQFDYYWRVEPGIKIHCDINYDLFKFMDDNQYEYSFTISLPEYGATIPTLWDTTRAFMKEHPEYVDPNNFMSFISDDGGSTYNGCHFWSNFEIGKLSLWNSQAYLDYFTYLDKAGGFFYERWGDAPVHSIAVSLFLDKEKIHFFDDIGYYHVPFNNCPVDKEVRIANKCSCNPNEDVTFKGYFCTNKYYKLKNLSKPEGWEKYGD